MWKIGASICGRTYVPHNIFEEYKNAGIDYMEISLAHPQNRDDIEGEYNQHTSLDMANIRKSAEKWGNGKDFTGR